MTASPQRKGRDGQMTFKALLRERAWTVDGLESGTVGADLLAVDPDGVTWMIECKNTVAIQLTHRRQAMKQAAIKKARWMLASKIAGSSSWLVQRQNKLPCVWHERETAVETD